MTDMRSPGTSADRALEDLKAKLREITKECVARFNKALGNDKPWRKIG